MVHQAWFASFVRNHGSCRSQLLTVIGTIQYLKNTLWASTLGNRLEGVNQSGRYWMTTLTAVLKGLNFLSDCKAKAAACVWSSGLECGKLAPASCWYCSCDRLFVPPESVLQPGPQKTTLVCISVSWNLWLQQVCLSTWQSFLRDVPSGCLCHKICCAKIMAQTTSTFPWGPQVSCSCLWGAHFAEWANHVLVARGYLAVCWRLPNVNCAQHAQWDLAPQSFILLPEPVDQHEQETAEAKGKGQSHQGSVRLWSQCTL